MEVYIQNIIIYLKKLLVIPGVIFLLSCENEIEKINLLTSTKEYPDISGKNVEIIYSDSGKVQLKLKAEEIKKFSRIEKPYIEFPKGIDVVMYNDTLGIIGTITAGYAIYYNEAKLWEARNKVVARNIEKGDLLNTEELFWDEGKELIYSNIYSSIETMDGIYYGQKGFVADQKLTWWKLIGMSGTVKLKNESTSK